MGSIPYSPSRQLCLPLLSAFSSATIRVTLVSTPYPFSPSFFGFHKWVIHTTSFWLSNVASLLYLLICITWNIASRTNRAQCTYGIRTYHTYKHIDNFFVLSTSVVLTHARPNTDIPSGPPFVGWAHNFHDRPAYPLTLLQNTHCKVDLATSWPSGCFSFLLYLERASKRTQFGLRPGTPDYARNFNFVSTNLYLLRMRENSSTEKMLAYAVIDIVQ